MLQWLPTGMGSRRPGMHSRTPDRRLLRQVAQDRGHQQFGAIVRTKFGAKNRPWEPTVFFNLTLPKSQNGGAATSQNGAGQIALSPWCPTPDLNQHALAGNRF
jgi:hypothetical protein